MNQIIFNYDYKKDIYSTKRTFFKNKKKFYFSIFIILIITILIISSYIIYNKYTIYKKNLNSNNIISTYNISTLYSSTNNYSSIQLSNNISIIGLIEIPCIDICYPILSQSTEELLKISVCRFSRSFAKS